MSMSNLTQFLILSTLILLAIPLTLSRTYNCSHTAKNINLGSPIIVCIHIVYQRSGGDVINTYAFNTTVDTFSAFKINNTATKFSTQTTPILAAVQVQNSANVTQMLIFNKDLAGGVYRDIFSFVVNINNGEVTSITDDTADCGSCQTDQQCSSNTNEKCFSKKTYYNGTDPKFFISWIGTDNSGNYMLSHTKRLSRFSQYSIGSIYRKAVNTLTTII